MFEYIFKNYKNFPLEIDDPQNTNQKIPNPQIKNNNDVYQYFTKELHLTFLDPTIKDVTNEYLKEYFTIAVLKINRDLNDYQLSTETKWNTLSNDDKLHLRNAICLLIKFIFEKGNDSFQTNKNYSVSPISVNDINQFLKFEYSVPVISELEQVSVFFLQQVLKKRENQLEYDDRFFKAVRATFLDLFIDEYPATAGVLVSKLLSSKDFEDFIKQHAKGPKGDKGDPGSGGGGAEKTNDLLTFNPSAEGGTNQYRINILNKDNIGALTSQLRNTENNVINNTSKINTNENKILANESKINQNDTNIRNNRSNVTTARTNIDTNTRNINTNSQRITTVANLSNNNKSRLDNLPAGSGGGGEATFKSGTKVRDVDLKIVDVSTKLRRADKKWIFSQDNIELFELGKYLHKAFKSLSMNGNQITDLADGTLPRDAMNKRSVDRLINTLEREGIDVNTVNINNNKALINTAIRQLGTNTRNIIVNSNKLLPIGNFIKFNGTNVEFWNQGKKIAEWYHTASDTDVHLIKFFENLSVSNNKITDLAMPLFDNDAVNKKYVDDEIARLPSGSGGGVATFKDKTTRTDWFDLSKISDIRFRLKINNVWILSFTNTGVHFVKNIQLFSNSRIKGLSPGIDDKDATNLKQVKDLIAASSGGGKWFGFDVSVNSDGEAILKVAGNENLAILSTYNEFHKPLTMRGNKILGLGTPTADTDAATKKYVDDNVGSAGDVTFAGGTKVKDVTITKTTEFGSTQLAFSVGGWKALVLKEFGPSSLISFFGNLSMNGNYRIRALKDGIYPGDAVNKKQLDDAIKNVGGGGIKKFTVVVKNNRQPYIVDNTTGENITLTTIPSGLKTQIELNFSENSIINNSRWKVLCEFVPTVEDIQTVGDATGDFITVAGLIVPNDPSPIDNVIYVDVWDTDFKDPGTTFNTTQYHISQQPPENNVDRWDYTEYQAMGNLFMLIHYQKYNTTFWDQPHIKRKFKFDFESQFIDNKRNNYIAIESQMKNQGKLYLVGGATKLSPVVGQQKIDIMTKINVEHASNKSDIQNLKIYFQKMTGSRTALNARNFTFIEPGNGTKLTFILQEKFEDLSEQIYEEQDEAKIKKL